MGMSCVGKTTFAKTLSHQYCCFDALFPWGDIETLGLSTTDALDYVSSYAEEVGEPFVIDGWHLSDPEGNQMPQNTTVCVVYAPYDQIISQYRVPVERHEQHRMMFKEWYYKIEYPAFQSRLFFQNTGHSFIETSVDDYVNFLERNR